MNMPRGTLLPIAQLPRRWNSKMRSRFQDKYGVGMEYRIVDSRQIPSEIPPHGHRYEDKYGVEVQGSGK